MSKKHAFLGIALSQRGFTDVSPCDLGCEQCRPGHSFGPAIRDNYLIHYVVSGKGVLYSEGNAYPVRAGEIFIIHPREVTTYTADTQEPWRYIWVGFNGLLARRLDSLNGPVLPYSADTFFEMLQAAELVSTREEFVAAKILEMLSVLSEDKKQVIHYEQQVMNYINANYMNHITVDSIAAFLNLDRRYLSRLFKSRTGTTVSAYLIQTRLQHAALLLTEGYHVAQAASMAGYPDPFNFSKMFKKMYGLSPTAYRQREFLSAKKEQTAGDR